MRRRGETRRRPETGATLGIVLIFITAVLILAAAIGGVVLANVRVVELSARAEEAFGRAESAVEAVVARLSIDSTWQPAGSWTVGWEDGEGVTITAMLNLAVETPPARLVAVGRAADATVEQSLFLDAPTLLGILAETEVRIESGVTVTSPVVGDPVWLAPGDPPPAVEAIVAPADAPAPRLVTEAAGALASAATRVLADPIHDGVTWTDEIVVLVPADPADTQPFTLKDIVLDRTSVLVEGDLVITGGLAATPRPGYPLLVVRGRLAVGSTAAARSVRGVIAAAGDVEIQGRWTHRGLVQGATVRMAGTDGAPVEIDDEAGGEVVGFEARVRRLAWERR